MANGARWSAIHRLAGGAGGLLLRSSIPDLGYTRQILQPGGDAEQHARTRHADRPRGPLRCHQRTDRGHQYRHRGDDADGGDGRVRRRHLFIHVAQARWLGPRSRRPNGTYTRARSTMALICLSLRESESLECRAWGRGHSVFDRPRPVPGTTCLDRLPLLQAASRVLFGAAGRYVDQDHDGAAQPVAFKHPAAKLWSATIREQTAQVTQRGPLGPFDFLLARDISSAREKIESPCVTEAHNGYGERLDIVGK